MPKTPKRYWNYRLIRKPTGDAEAPFFFDMHEVHYDDGKPIGYTSTPCTFGGETPDEAARGLSRALKDALCEPWIDVIVFGTLPR